MKHTFKQNAGFTLIELVVAMAMAVIVTAAATSVLLMGLRVNRQTGDTATQQMTVRSLLNVLEKAAVDGNIKDIVTNHASWELVNVEIENGGDANNYRAIFGFDAEKNRIYTGREYDENRDVLNEGTTILEGVYASNVTIEGDLLSVSIETKEGIFSTSIYCRITDLKDDSLSNNLPSTDVVGNRGEFIKKLQSQYRSRGEIVGADPDSPYQYYSEWYIDLDYDAPGYTGEWKAETPWCACFVSWALDQVRMPVPDYCNDDEHEGHPHWYANVDEFMEYFTPRDATDTATAKWLPGGSKPTAGDLIFFDWDKGTDPEHVGVVIEVKTVKIGDQEKIVIYTIEGNSSGRVAIRSYTLGDKRIIGYGVLPWQSES